MILCLVVFDQKTAVLERFLSVQSEPKKRQILSFFSGSKQVSESLKTPIMTGNDVPNTKIMFECIYLYQEKTL